MKLHYRLLETENTPKENTPLFILHGLFGSSDNWQTLGKTFSEKFPVYLVDQRNHGHSGHTDEFDYDLMCADFKELIDDLGLKKINLLGHSMGGKTAILFAEKHAELLNKLIVADISYKAYPPHHDQILKGLNALDLSILKTRGAADEALADYIPEISVRQFLLKNLYWVEKGQLGWRINIPVLTREIGRIVGGIPLEQIQVDTLFIRGGKSNYILPSDYADIHQKFPNGSIHSIEESGHWVHAEAPEEFYQTVVDFLS